MVHRFSLVLMSALTGVASIEHAAAQDLGAATATPSASPAQTPSTSQSAAEQITVVGVAKELSVLPTSLTSSTAYGIDLNVMETPRNNTVLTHAQLDALNIQDPQELSYLTSSSYTDASFGTPNIPRIRGQFADVFFNGMRDSFTLNGYGAPLSYNSIDTMDIIKGPASVQAGPGAGVGGSINISTKQPYFDAFKGEATAEFDEYGKRRWSVDFGGPINDRIAYRLSYTGEDSDSYYNGMYFREQALYGDVTFNVTDKYTINVSSEIAYADYKEDDGINRVSQQLINSGQYLTGGVAPGTPLLGFGSLVLLGNPVSLSDRVNIDEAPDTEAHSLRFNLQVQQNYQFTDAISVSNNTFLNVINRDNQTQDYYSDSTKGSYTIENKTDFQYKFSTPISDGFDPGSQIDAGFTFRDAHVDNIQNFVNEAISVFDLSGPPSSFMFPAGLQAAGGAIQYESAFGRLLWGVPGRNGTQPNSTVNSDLYDAGLFLEHRITITPELSVMYGLRGDLVHLEEYDPLGGALYYDYASNTVLPDHHNTAWYGLGNANFSPVWKFAPWGSAYLTYNYAQYVNSTTNDGGVGTFGVADDSELQQTTRLYEGGLKFSLIENKLFLSTAAFSQARSIPTGPGGSTSSFAHIRGGEAELDYQPEPHFFLTASYSFIRTILETPAQFYNFPAQPGLNLDGSGVLAVWQPNQQFTDPGVPEHVFNFLGNYRFDDGIGVQTSLQVTGPIATTTSGTFNVAASEAAGAILPASVIASGGRYQSPVIPWQYTLNAGVYYDIDRYEFKLQANNLTNQHNLVNDNPFYGNDFITRVQPLTLDFTMKVKF
jgi:TonB dependent receptor-like, beta-barrel/TonB-dependent Receptor Plug Domain